MAGGRTPEKRSVCATPGAGRGGGIGIGGWWLTGANIQSTYARSAGEKAARGKVRCWPSGVAKVTVLALAATITARTCLPARSVQARSSRSWNSRTFSRNVSRSAAAGELSTRRMAEGAGFEAGSVRAAPGELVMKILNAPTMAIAPRMKSRRNGAANSGSQRSVRRYLGWGCGVIMAAVSYLVRTPAMIGTCASCVVNQMQSEAGQTPRLA